MWKRLGLFNLFSVIISEYISIDSITKDLMYSIHVPYLNMLNRINYGKENEQSTPTYCGETSKIQTRQYAGGGG